MSVSVAVILDRKGSGVVTIPGDATLLTAADVLSQHNIGALVVSPDGDAVEGIVSERDVVRVLAGRESAALDRPVTEVMSTSVATCSLDTTVDELMALMTQRRIRHVPVVDDDMLVGIVSIGDVVKLRLDELEMQTEALERYVTGSAS